MTAFELACLDVLGRTPEQLEQLDALRGVAFFDMGRCSEDTLRFIFREPVQRRRRRELEPVPAGVSEVRGTGGHE